MKLSGDSREPGVRAAAMRGVAAARGEGSRPCVGGVSCRLPHRSLPAPSRDVPACVGGQILWPCAWNALLGVPPYVRRFINLPFT